MWKEKQENSAAQIGGHRVILIFVLSFTADFLKFCDGTLDCFSCTDIDDVENCHSIKTCSETELCYAEHYNQSGTMLYALGCREKLFCSGMDVTEQFGRRQTDGQSSGCTQCCGLHGCNKYLCPFSFTVAPQPVDGGWSAWGNWGQCQPPCGIGLRFRRRECNNPIPTANGKQCVGDSKEIAICNTTCTDPPSTTPTTIVDPPQSTTSGKPTPYLDQYTTTPPQYVTNDLTQAPGQCDDLIDCSEYYRPEACHGIYSAWAHRYCPVHCGFCPTPSPIPCADTIDNCHEYETDMCTREEFWQWRESHCRKYCGLC